MKNRLLLILLPVMFIFLFTGCGSKHGTAHIMTKNIKNCVNHSNKYKNSNSFCQLTKDYDIINIIGKGDKSMFTITKYNNSTAAGLQVAAESTLKMKHKYFSFVYPEQLSNFSGSLINTPEEYFKKCDINTANVLSFNLDPCSFHANPLVINVVIITFEERPEDVLTYDANEVLEYLKKEERFDPESSLKETNF